MKLTNLKKEDTKRKSTITCFWIYCHFKWLKDRNKRETDNCPEIRTLQIKIIVMLAIRIVVIIVAFCTFSKKRALEIQRKRK